MQYDPELFEAVKGILEKAHRTWGDFTGSGAAYAILEEFDVWQKKTVTAEMDQKIREAVNAAESRVNAVKQVRLILGQYGEDTNIHGAIALVDSIRERYSYPRGDIY